MDTYRLVVKRANKGVSVTIFGGCDGGLGLDHGVDATDFGLMLARQHGQLKAQNRTSVGYLSSNLKEKVVFDIANRLGLVRHVDDVRKAKSARGNIATAKALELKL